MSRRCLGVAHLQTRPCPWPLSLDPTRCAVDPVFDALPSLALEEVFWYHLRNEALGDVANKDEDGDDAKDAFALRAWLGSCKPLRGSPEFCRAARRLLATWPQPARHDSTDIAWRGVLPPSSRGAGTVTYVWGWRASGKTTAALRIARVLTKRVQHVLCAVHHRREVVDKMFGALGITLDRIIHAEAPLHEYSVAEVWEAAGPLVRAHAHEGVLVIATGLSGDDPGAATVFKQARDIGVHLVVTSGRPPVPALVPHMDRVVLCCKCNAKVWSVYAFDDMGIDHCAVNEIYRACIIDEAARGTIVFQRRRDDTWDTQVMPYMIPLAAAPPV
ncbi:hypothetical protein TW95_gp0008 [Pandoravirus inopinatum]|uniref:Uncharacterized protein n=1 Tax=Pandoravirus inopinatum TaxID=1605721 RepID=A0A0B5JB27_9VIRU|nr:hypothetical protein TW95_gp0008 [Pandoravirus inopinatum]AJF96742.1 hypothetical protein [Pandoravirus inopinatum]